MAPSALGVLEPGPFSSRVLLRLWRGSGSQGHVCVRAGGGHSSRVELVLPWASWRLGPLPESPRPGRPSAPCLSAPSGGATLRPSGDSPTGCLSPARGPGCAHCASGPVSGLASHVCTRVCEPVCLWFFGCTPVPQAARPLARIPGWAHLSRAAREADWGRRPAHSIGPAPTCLGSGQGACREPRGTLAGWARHCWGGCPEGWAQHYWGGAPCRVGSALLGGPPCRGGSALLGEGSCRPSKGCATVILALGRAFLSCPD